MSITPKQTIKGTVAATQSARGVLKDIPSLDNTLTKEDYAADAKATGEAISQALTDANTYTDTHTRSNTWMPSAEEVGARPDTWMPTAADVGARPDTWKPTAQEVGARPNTWLPTTDEIGAATPADVQKFARKNLLDNWYFGNPVNQRGQTNYANSWSYTIDRWLTSESVALGDGFLSASGLFYQKLDTHVFNAVRGKTVTVSVLLQDGTLAFHTNTFPTDNNASADVNGVSIYFGGNIPGFGMNFPVIAIVSTRNIVAIKLELGTEQTLAHQENGVWVLNEIPDYREELAKCQSHQIVLDGTNVSVIGMGIGASADLLRILIPTPVEMRVIPSITLQDGAQIFAHSEGSVLSTTTIDSVVGKNAIGVTVMFAIPLGENKSCSIQLVGGKLLLDANL